MILMDSCNGRQLWLNAGFADDDNDVMTFARDVGDYIKTHVSAELKVYVNTCCSVEDRVSVTGWWS